MLCRHNVYDRVKRCIESFKRRKNFKMDKAFFPQERVINRVFNGDNGDDGHPSKRSRPAMTKSIQFKKKSTKQTKQTIKKNIY